ncbi:MULTISPECIES: hypothetical protein [unclassified Streptomyces]|uniref:hypothetical protein n=1 Tax=unclassified Streptomyces TaxID=2593676 RepID=UPI001660D0F9|nr:MULTISPECIES: hypothetical protein [unclassified Streptomyces]MBD0707537.1 hypothetical protein [Streptomyces sp. CBMA291]MBD0718031.1 hypothetical protein [Streptomyces sp. CBMA370]
MTGRDDGVVTVDTVVGRLFVEALNAGLARARETSAVSTGGSRTTTAPRPAADPFATAVLGSFDTALPAVLPTRDRRDIGLQTAMRRRARQVVAAALAAARRSAPPSLLPVEPSELALMHERLVRTLLLECAALTVCDTRRFPAGTVPPADLVRELGRSLRTSRRPA